VCVAVKDNTHPLVLLDRQGLVKLIRQKLSADQSLRKKLRTSCLKEEGVLYKIVTDKNIVLKTCWIEGYAGRTRNDFSNIVANVSSCLAQLGLFTQMFFQKQETNNINILLVFMNKKTMNGDILKLVCQCVGHKGTKKV
jgi:hypothetical protein